MATKVATLPNVHSWSPTEARTGRTRQRYAADAEGGNVRLCCGCVPVVLSEGGEKRVILISSRKKNWTLPKGGWEKDETAMEAALRETFEEAGVVGDIVDETPLCAINYESCKNASCCRVHFYAMLVTDVLSHWPEEDQRNRIVVSLPEARQLISKPWMHEALDAVEAISFKPSLTPTPARSSDTEAIAEADDAIMQQMKWITAAPGLVP
eukprot:scaffold470_cov257-Pinguiococcus_pyrenoidosus.AAC.11